MKPLVIYESPNKFRVFTSMFSGMDVSFCYTQGRIYDLPENNIGLNKDLTLVLIPVSNERESFLKAKIAKHDLIYCLTDNDPEGEWIASHIKEIAEKYGKSFLRPRISELTKSALVNALANADDMLDNGLLSKAISRRVIDRIIGYQNNEDKDLKRGRVLTPVLSYIQNTSINSTQSIIVCEPDGTQIQITGSEFAIRKALTELTTKNEKLVESSSLGSVDLFNTMDYLKNRSLEGKTKPTEAFEELQTMYEQGLVSYTRTLNKSYEVLNGEHKGICALNIDLENEDESDFGGSPIGQIKMRTLLHRMPEKYDVRDCTPSRWLAKLCDNNDIQIIYLKKITKKRESVHEIDCSVFLLPHPTNKLRKRHCKLFEHTKEYELLSVLEFLDVGQPSTFHSHVKKIGRLTYLNEKGLVLNSHGIRVALQTDELSLSLANLESYHIINSLLDNNTLSIEQKNEKCLNVLRISDPYSGSEFGLDV